MYILCIAYGYLTDYVKATYISKYAIRTGTNYRLG